MALTIIEKIDKWFNPYKYEGLEALIAYKTPSNRVKGKTAQEVVDSNVTVLHLETQEQPFSVSEAVLKLNEEPFDNGLYFHNHSFHQLATKYNRGACMRYQARNATKRKKLRKNMLIYPKNVEVYDATHLQPIVFHGTDDNPKLLVGWDSNQNRVDMRLFEAEVIKINTKQPIIWYVSIELLNDFSCDWHSIVYSIDGEMLLEKSFHDPSNFKWQLEG